MKLKKFYNDVLTVKFYSAEVREASKYWDKNSNDICVWFYSKKVPADQRYQGPVQITTGDLLDECIREEGGWSLRPV